MKSSSLILLVVGSFLAIHAYAEASVFGISTNELSAIEKDSSVHNIRDFVSKGNVSGNIRSYFMATVNKGELSDYYTNAIGARLGYTSAELFGFQLGIEGTFVYNVAGNNLSSIDPFSNKGSRYEVQLYEITDRHQRKDLNRLNELFIRYNLRNSSISLGKLNRHSPLVNEQDSRMVPYVFEGAWAEIRELASIRIQLGYFWRISPRSTTDWYSINDAIGMYSNGYYTDGTKADYKGAVNTNGIAIAGIDYIINDNLKASVWNYYLDNVMNSVFSQLDYKKGKYILGIQYLRQDPVANGGEIDSKHSYFNKNQSSNVIASRVGLRIKRQIISLNYTKITSSGRFVFPREFGREQFYSTIPRMRLEGLGNTDALAVRYSFSNNQSKKLELRLESGVARTPDPYDYELNKYGVASFAQGIFDLRYRPDDFWKGLSFRLLYMYKENLKNYNDLSLVFNNSNIHHFNFITNLSF